MESKIDLMQGFVNSLVLIQILKDFKINAMFATIDFMILPMFRIKIMLTVVVPNCCCCYCIVQKWHFDIILFNKTNVCDKPSWQLAYFLCRKNKCDTYFCTKFWRFHGYSLAMKSNNLMKMKVDLQISNFPTRKSQRKFVNICSKAWTRNLHRTTYYYHYL